MPTVTCPMPDQESSQDRSAWSARSYEGIEHPANPRAARRSCPRWSSTRYSITWSARCSSVRGMVRPSVFAVSKLDDDQLDAESGRCLLRPLHLCPGRGLAGGEDGDPGSPRDDFLNQLQALANHRRLRGHDHSSDVSARPREACDQPEFD